VKKPYCPGNANFEPANAFRSLANGCATSIDIYRATAVSVVVVVQKKFLSNAPK
jgi:hypothetical protein